MDGTEPTDRVNRTAAEVTAIHCMVFVCGSDGRSVAG